MLKPGFYNMDCMEGMKEYPDGYFDLAIVDPPYGGGNDRGGVLPIHSGRMVQPVPADVCRTGGKWASKYGKKIIAWDTAPGQEYFQELFRVSRNQIIWGGNYFTLPPTRCFLVWRKLSISEDFSMAMCEYAWTSFNDNAKLFECAPQGTASERRFHPTQKPVKLYSWILSRYAKEGDKILDTHVGSASSLIACYRAGLEYTGFEIDPEYYRNALERLESERNQINMFELLHG